MDRTLDVSISYFMLYHCLRSHASPPCEIKSEIQEFQAAGCTENKLKPIKTKLQAYEIMRSRLITRDE